MTPSKQVWNSHGKTTPDLSSVPRSSYLGDFFGVVVLACPPKTALLTLPALLALPNLFSELCLLFCMVPAEVLVILGGILLMDISVSFG